jgi:hypothetical protein
MRFHLELGVTRGCPLLLAYVQNFAIYYLLRSYVVDDGRAQSSTHALWNLNFAARAVAGYFGCALVRRSRRSDSQAGREHYGERPDMRDQPAVELHDVRSDTWRDVVLTNDIRSDIGNDGIVHHAGRNPQRRWGSLIAFSRLNMSLPE